MISFQTHLPGYVTDFDKLKAKGIDVIACVSVNDPFVMEAWGNSVGAGDKVNTFDFHTGLVLYYSGNSSHLSHGRCAPTIFGFTMRNTFK